MRAYLQQLLAQGKTAHVLEELLKKKKLIQSLNLEEEVILQSARLEQYEKNNRLGLISQEEQQITLAKINQAVFQIVAQLPSDGHTTDGNESSKKKNRWWQWIVGIGVVVGILAGLAEISGWNLRELFFQPVESTIPQEPKSDTSDINQSLNPQSIEPETANPPQKSEDPKKSVSAKPKEDTQTHEAPELNQYEVKGKVIDQNYQGLEEVAIIWNGKQLGTSGAGGMFRFLIEQPSEIQLMDLVFVKEGFVEGNKSVIMESGIGDAKQIILEKNTHE